jgi:flagellar biosynthesis regulator FlaF
MSSDSSHTVEHRTFLLTLDNEDGDSIAQQAGFTPASEDVHDREREQVTKDWAILDAEGVLDELQKYAHWFSDVAIEDDTLSDHERSHATQSAVVFAAAAIARLKNRGFIETPTNRRLVAVVRSEDGVIKDNRLPEELLEHAADMYAWQHDIKDDEQ